VLLAGGTAVEVALVAAVVQVGPAPVELEDPGGDAVEDVAVVGDEHQRPGEAGQPALEPLDAIAVEVVGGLVEDQQVGLVGLPVCTHAHQGAGQRHPLGLAAREGAHLRIEPGRHPQAVEHGLALPGPAGHLAHGAGGQRRVWSRWVTRAPRPRRTSPASGSTAPASTPSSVDFPHPLIPTTARRSPVATVTDRPVKSGLPGRLAARSAASTRITTGHLRRRAARHRHPGCTT
jgi:hypothetical protein